MPSGRVGWKRRTAQSVKSAWVKLRSALSRFHIWLRRPTTVVAAIGVVGLSLDLFWKPLTTGALVMLGLIALPGLLKIVKRAKIAGVELEAQTPDEVEQRIEREVVQNAADAVVVVHGDAGQPAPSVKQVTSSTFSHYERLAISRIASLYGGVAKTDVRIGDVSVDAVIERDSGSIGIEVKHVSEFRIGKAALKLHREIRLVIRRFSNIIYSNDHIDRFFLVLVGYFPKDTKEWTDLSALAHKVRIEFPSIGVRVFSTDDFDNPTNPMFQGDWGK